MKLPHYLSIFASIALLSISAAAIHFVCEYDGVRPPESFHVTGKGTVFATPDIAQFTYSVIAEGPTLTDLYSQIDTEAQETLAFLTQSGVSDDDIKTTGFSVNPRYSYPRCEPGTLCPPPSIVGYSLQKTYTVKIRDIEEADALLAGTVERGAQSVSQLSFSVDNDDTYLAKARTKAVAAAKKKARALAYAADIELGDIVSISENRHSYHPQPYMSVRSEAVGIGGGGSADTSMPGQNEITLEVFLNYEIK